MGEKLNIKLTIADRVYPLTIDPQQEASLRRACKNIEDLIKQFEEKYAVRDKQDVLAMCALQFASKIELKGAEGEDTYAEMQERLLAVDSLLQRHLS